MKRRYGSAVVIVITLFSMLIAYNGESQAEGRMCQLPNIKWEGQQNDYWCWVAAVSMVLKSYGLDGGEQCQLYDLSNHNTTTSCKDKDQFPTEWKHMKDGSNKEKNNQFGYPQVAAKEYSDLHRNKIEYEVKSTPFSSFDELANEVCPSDISQGRPFIWAYDKTVAAHDNVVYGFNDLGPNEDKYLYVYDPNSPPPEEVRKLLDCDSIPDPPYSCNCDELLDPACNGVLFESYRDGDPRFVQDLFIRKK